MYEGQNGRIHKKVVLPREYRMIELKIENLCDIFSCIFKSFEDT